MSKKLPPPRPEKADVFDVCCGGGERELDNPPRLAKASFAGGDLGALEVVLKLKLLNASFMPPNAPAP